MPGPRDGNREVNRVACSPQGRGSYPHPFYRMLKAKPQRNARFKFVISHEAVQRTAEGKWE